MSRMGARLKRLGVRTSTAVIKSWANAWTTSTRMHEESDIGCLFGCEREPDKLEHYLSCDHLWTVVISCTFRRVELLHAVPFVKLGFGENSNEWLQMLSVAFACYHQLKFSHMSEIEACRTAKDYSVIHLRLVGYARVYSNELLRQFEAG